MKKEVTLAFLALSVVFGTSRAPAQTPAYHANLLGLSDGRTNIQVEHPSGLNRWGQLIGTYGGDATGGTHAVLWTPNSANDGFGAGILYSLESTTGLPAGTADTSPTGINDRGQIVGTAFTPGQGDANQNQSFMWRPSSLNSSTGLTLNSGKGAAVTFPLEWIPGLGTLAEYGQVINNKGVIAAHGIFYHALLWTPSVLNGTTSTLGWTYEPNYCSPPSGINDAGKIAGGTCESGSENVPYLHSGALPLLASDLITSPLWLQPPTPNGIGGANGLNQRGHLAVTAVDKAGTQIRAYLYKSGAATDLSTGLTSQANALNNYDQVVGHADTDTRRAILFERGKALDLNGVKDSINGLLLKDAIAVNNYGQILCNGVYPGGTGATILLTPLVIDATSKVAVVKGSLLNFTQQTVMLTNNGPDIAGPVSLVLDGLTGGVKLANASGATFYKGPTGSPYINFSAGVFAAGTTVPVTLNFTNPSLKSVAYTTRVLGGPAPR